MFARFLAVPFLFVVGLFAQSPPGHAPLVVNERFVYVLRGDVLYQFDAETLGLLHTFDFRTQAPVDRSLRADAPRRRPAAGAAPEAARPRPEPASVEALGAAVDAALQWLVAHQDEDGRWDADQFMKHDLKGQICDGPGNPVHDVGVTGLALLALLGNGSTMRVGPHKDAVKRAAQWLRSQQAENGLVGTNASHDFVYDHAIATFALCEAYGLSNYRLLAEPAQKALNYLESHRNPYAVWRYQPRDNDNDTSVTTWAAFALCSGKFFGLQTNETAHELIGVWYDQVTDDSGRAGYSKRGEPSSRKPGDHGQRFPPERGEAMTAAALAGRFFLGQTPEQKPIMARSAHLLLARPPQWEKGSIDPYYWYMGTLAMYQMGGEAWAGWSPHLSVLVEKQRRDDNFAGSWDPVGVWDEDGGRVQVTALNALTLESCARAAKGANAKRGR